ncbi:28S ribosomal protein S18c, mitochondrial [Centrocercus urophasianus]|uniref:28S ribosomal protein S18c, mitochondrial n=1 Tax=Centrocercus urophasianus TaxID=9002 RepID=UPI001C64511A|nr:28S ribosomal protein S18c, mitochondrial [Centrocercus urophasianus]
MTAGNATRHPAPTAASGTRIKQSHVRRAANRLPPPVQAAAPLASGSYFRLAEWRGGSCAQRGVGEVKMAALAVRGGRLCCGWVPALMRERPCRLQHQQAAVGSDLPIEMENPYKEPPKKCILCGINVDYKNVQLLSQFVSPYSGRIYGRHITGLCDKKQKEISKAIKRAHILDPPFYFLTGFMPVMFKNPSFLTDPKICNVKY